MTRRGRSTPLTPIWNPKKRRGAVDVGSTPGTPPAPPPPGCAEAALPPAILALGPVLYYKLVGDDANTLFDFGSGANNATNSGITLAGAAGPDGCLYPIRTSTGAHILGADDDLYAPQLNGGLTVLFLAHSANLINTIRDAFVKVTAAPVGEWRIQMGHSQDNIKVSARTLTTAGGTGRRTDFTSAIPMGGTCLVIVRFSASATGYPTVRINGVNGGTTSGTGTAVANTTTPVRAFGHGGGFATDWTSDRLLAHTTIYTGILSDADCATIETAAQADGWY